MLSLKQKSANEIWLKEIAKKTKLWGWQDHGLFYTISDENKFVCDTTKWLRLSQIVRVSFMRNNCIAA